MNVHKNARLTPRGRERIVELVANGQTPKAVGEAVGVCPCTVRKWVDRHRREGLAGLQDRSPGHIGCADRHRSPLSRRLSGCVGSAGRASRLPPKLASRPLPSVVFFAGRSTSDPTHEQHDGCGVKQGAC